MSLCLDVKGQSFLTNKFNRGRHQEETSRKILTVQIFLTVEVARQTALTTLHRRFLLQ